MPEFECRTDIAAPARACFDLSLSVDAHTASMGPSGERAVAGVRSGEMTLGDTVTWRARHFGIPFTMTSAITAYEAPHRFVDEQVSGPFRRWWHEHTFVTVEERGAGSPERTLMIDRVRFDAPMGPLGRAVERVGLTRYLVGLIEQRNDWLAATLEGRR